MSEEDEVYPVVIDNGSYNCRAGFAGDCSPSAVFPSIVGTLRHQTSDKAKSCESYVGDHAQTHRDMLALRTPIANGVVKHWDNMEKLWNYLFRRELRVNISDRDVLTSEPVLNPKSNREKMMEVMFETFQTSGFYVCADGILAQFSSGRVTALNVGVGKELTQALPVYDGFAIPKAFVRSEIGGTDVTNHLGRLLRKRGFYLNDHVNPETCDSMKQRVCYVAQDSEEEIRTCNISSTKSTTYELSDGTVVPIGPERSTATEVLFNTSLIDKEVLALHDVVQTSLEACDEDIRSQLYSNIILFGSCTMLPGLPERLRKELTHLVPSTVQVKVIAAPERRASVFLGASVFGGLSYFDETKITKREYQEIGSNVVHTKTFRIH